jgi:hypothetical protein
MNLQEKIQILNKLQQYNNLYYTFFNLCDIEYTDKIDTLAVSCNKDSDDIILSINLKFWNILNIPQKCFVISHECLHIIFNHLTRLKYMIQNDKTINIKILNIAADLCVNESLIRSYKFIRSEVDMNYYWLDTCFPDGSVSYGHNLEYYYEKLLDSNIPDGGLVDFHGDWEATDIPEDNIKNIISNLSENEKETLEKVLSIAGTDDFVINKILQKKDIKKNKKWEAIVQNWVKSKLEISDKEISQWARTNRRFVTLQSNFFIPTEMEIENKEKKKYNVYFFLDVSGSCRGYAQRFYDSARSIPTDKFNVKFLCFSTWVKEIDIENKKIPNGGGTSFSIIENYLNKQEEYPDGVFILTDGYGNSVKPKHPDRWIWMLTGSHSIEYIPKDSKKFKLKEYE